MPSTPATPTSPKVKAGAAWSAYASLGLTVLGTITPESLAFLGPYAPLAYGLVIGGSYALGSYLKEDALRTEGARALAEKEAPSSSASIPSPSLEKTPSPVQPETPAVYAVTMADHGSVLDAVRAGHSGA